MKRRLFLTGCAGVATAAVGGCQAPAGAERVGVTLTHVELGNATDEPQHFDLLVTHDGAVVHWEGHDVGVGTDDEAGGAVVEIDAPDRLGSVEVYVRVGDVWDRIDFDDDRYDGERVIAVVTYGLVEDELLRISRVVSDRPTDE